MATTVDTLLVRIESDMTGIKRDLARLDRQTAQTSRSVQTSMSKMGSAIKGALGVAALLTIGRFIAQNVKLASSVQEMQSKSSVVFGRFVSGVRKDLEEFGDAVGRATHDLEQMASSVQDTFVPLGFSRGEAAKLSVALTKLAVDVASFNDANDVETMRAFQSALVGNHEAVRRFGIVITEAELKAELFRMGINKAAKDVDGATKVQARLNLIMAGTKDAQGDAERTADSFANRMKALGAALSELSVVVFTPFLDGLGEIVESLTDAANATADFLKQFGFFSQVDMDSLVSVETRIKAIREEITTLSKLGKEAGAEAFFSTDLQIETLNNELKDLLEVRTKLLELQNQESEAPAAPTAPTTLTDTQKTLAKLQDQEKVAIALLRDRRLETELNALSDAKRLDALQGYTIVLDDETKALIAQARATAKAEKALEAHSDALSAAESFLEGMKTETEQLTELQNQLTIAYDAGTMSYEKYTEAQNLIKKQMIELKPEFKRLQDAANTAADGISNALADAFVSGKLSMQSLGDVFKQVIKQMIADAIRAQIVKQLMSFGMSFFGGGGAVGGLSPAGFTSSSGTFGASDSFAGGGRIPARASGGPVMVGERGPELFIPHSAGVIRNNHDTMNMMNGAPQPVVNQTINIDAGVSQTVRAEVMSMIPRIKSETIAAMMDGKRRGNSISKVF